MGIGNSISLKTMKERETERAKRIARIWLCDSQVEYEIGDALVEFAKKEVRRASQEDKALIKELSEELEIRLREQMDKDIVDESLAILKGSARQDTKY